MMSDYNVEMVNDDMTEFNVEFHGPRDSKQFSFIHSLFISQTPLPLRLFSLVCLLRKFPFFGYLVAFS